MIEKFGRIDGVANVAGGQQPEEYLKLEETPLEVYRHVVNINLEYVFRICRDVALQMIHSGTRGSIVNVGSISLLTSAPYHGPYGAAKSGIAALTRTMAVEWRQHGIRANTVSPGAVPTEAVTSMSSIDPLADQNDKIIWTPMDAIANAIVFLLSDLAFGISGQNVSVDSSLSADYCAGMVGEFT
jgi:NAD(P)-dependent dehydrogenase (short-subunit alcohol dehydrogenase family)